MDCRNTKQLLHDFADGRLAESVARDVQRHMAECSDCRVFQQRDMHLQQLLAVKRHEMPGAAYFDNFLSEFHQRLVAETAPRPSFWQQLCERLNIQPVPKLRLSYAHALGAAFALALIWRGLMLVESPSNVGRQDFAIPHSTPQMIASELPTRSAELKLADLPVFPILAGTAFGAPRYVLDHIAATPASYEVASIHF